MANYGQLVGVRFKVGEREKLEEQAAAKKISLADQIRWLVDQARPLAPEVETIIRQLAERAQCGFSEVIEILVLSYTIREAARSIVWKKNFPCIEFQKTGKGKQLLGIPLGKRLMREYQAEEQRVRQSATPEEIRQQLDLLERFGNNLASIKKLLKAVGDALELRSMENVPGISALKASAEKQVKIVENMASQLSYLN